VPSISTLAPAGSTIQPADGTSTSSKPTLGYDDFLKLLLAQMQNQDPLKPMDSTEYVSQLATFSNVEQGIKQNAKLDQLLLSSSLAQGQNAIGKFVTSSDGATSGKVVSVRIDDTSATATLDNGKELLLGSGVKIGVA
jgi:flagellar basal-body rod modification protein FlgD